MGQKYYVEAKLNGNCLMQQESKSCKTLIGFLMTIIRFRLKYPIVNAKIRNGYNNCDKCNMGENKPFCDPSMYKRYYISEHYIDEMESD